MFSASALDQFQGFVQGLPEPLQWLGVVLISAVPFIESYFGSAIGVAAGIFPILAVLFAVLGNTASMLVFVLTAAKTRGAIKQRGGDPQPLSARKAKLKQRLDRYGVPLVSLAGQTVLPSQIVAAAMVSFGADTRKVILWQIISIVLWGAVFATLATIGFAVIR